MEALLLELQQLNDQAEALTDAKRFSDWEIVQKRRSEVINQIEAGR